MTRIGLAIAGLGMAAVLTACGGDDFTDQSGEEIADASKAAMKDLDSVKVSGSVSTDGAETRIDVQADADGNCTGSIGVGDGTAELLGVDGEVWFKPDETFWRDNGGADADQIIAAVGDKWVVAPEGQDGFDQFCDVSDLMDEMLKDDGDESTYTKGDTQDVDGDKAIAVDNKDSKGTSTGYILVDDPHYLVKIEKTEGDDTGSVTFSEFNADVDVEAPADDEIIDLSTLAG
jgi:hypothetical protein